MPPTTPKPPYRWIAGLVASFAGGFMVAYSTIRVPLAVVEREASTSLISPLIDCSLDTEYSVMNPDRKLRSKTQKVLDQFPKIQSSLYYRDLLNGPSFTINGSVKYDPASITKVPIMISYFKHAEENPQILNKPLEYLDHESGHQVRYPSEVTLENGALYPVHQLIENMIVHSDNIAQNSLIRDVQQNINSNNPKESVHINAYGDLFKSLHLEDPNRNLVQMSAKDLASFFRVLYNSTYLGRSYSKRALQLLTETRFDRGIRKGISDSEVLVASKFGEAVFEQQYELHECGIVYPKSGRTYLLCIMTRGPESEELEKLIAEASGAIYENRRLNE